MVRLEMGWRRVIFPFSRGVGVPKMKSALVTSSNVPPLLSMRLFRIMSLKPELLGQPIWDWRVRAFVAPFISRLVKNSLFWLTDWMKEGFWLEYWVNKFLEELCVLFNVSVSKK